MSGGYRVERFDRSAFFGLGSLGPFRAVRFRLTVRLLGTLNPKPL